LSKKKAAPKDTAYYKVVSFIYGEETISTTIDRLFQNNNKQTNKL